MGVLYSVIPEGEMGREPFGTRILRQLEMDPPPLRDESRNPTPKELHEVLDGLSGLTTEYVLSPGDWQAAVEAHKGLRIFRANTLLNVVDFSGDETAPHGLFFEQGDPKLILRILEAVARICGPRYVFPDTGARPLLVTPGIDPAQAVKAWASGQPDEDDRHHVKKEKGTSRNGSSTV